MRYTVSGAAAMAVASFFSAVEGHGFVNGAKVNGVWTAGSDPLWWYAQQNNQPLPVTSGWRALNQDIGFVEPANMGTTDIACHKSAKTNTGFIDVAAGSTITLFWNTWPEGHKGPIINYLAPVSEFASATAGSLSFTKIGQGALITGGSNSKWVTDTMIASNFSTPVTIPAKLKPGNYVLRHEIIALHAAGSDNGAQMYPQCLNLKVSGSGTVSLPSGVAATQLYKRNDAGIIFNLYQDIKSYPIPGPTLWTSAN